MAGLVSATASASIEEGIKMKRIDFVVKRPGAPPEAPLLANTNDFALIHRGDAVVIPRKSVWILLDDAVGAEIPYDFTLPKGSKGFTRRKLAEIVSFLIKSVMYEGGDPTETYAPTEPFDKLLLFNMDYNRDDNFCRVTFCAV